MLHQFKCGTHKVDDIFKKRVTDAQMKPRKQCFHTGLLLFLYFVPAKLRDFVELLDFAISHESTRNKTRTEIEPSKKNHVSRRLYV